MNTLPEMERKQQEELQLSGMGAERASFAVLYRKRKRLLICVAARPKETVPEGLGKSVWSADALLQTVPSEWSGEPSLVPRFWKGQPKTLAGTWKLVDLGVRVHLRVWNALRKNRVGWGLRHKVRGWDPREGGPIWLL